MNVTDEETERFLRLVHPDYRRDAINILSNMHASIIRTQIQIEGSHNRHNDNYILLRGNDGNAHEMADLSIRFIALNPVFAQFKKDDAAFIIEFISRHFNKLKLLFSSSMTRVFVEDINAMKDVVGFTYDTNKLEVNVFSNNNYVGSLDLSENNADVSDYMWNIILNNRDNVNFMMSAYVSGKYSVSDNIKKRLQALYDSLSDSDKLLLELGEDLTNI